MPVWLLKQPTHGIELWIENLEVQLANNAISPRLGDAKVILQSIISLLSPDRSYKKKTATLAQQAVHITVKISTLLAGITNDIPQLVKYCLEEILRDVQSFIQLETQSSIFHLHLENIITTRYVVLKERLGTLLAHFERYIMDLRNADSMDMGESRMPPPHSNGDVVRSGENVSIIINGGQHYNARKILIQQVSHQESDNGIVQGIRVITSEDISMGGPEICINQRYRLYSGNTSGKARIIKIYRGPRAKERCVAAAKFHKKVMHPSFLHMIGVSPIHSEVPFLVFDGEFKGTLAASIAAVLEKDDRNSVMLGLQTVIALSSGLSYLRDINYQFVSAGLQHFGAFLSLEGTVIITFDPLIEIDDDDHEELGSSFEVDKPLVIFHGLCKQTFDAACQIHYDGQQIKRGYDDILEDADRFEDVDENSNLESAGNSISSMGASALPQDTLKRRPGQLPNNGRRRELVWKSDSTQMFPLEDIFHEFKTFHDALPVSSVPKLHYRRGRYAARTAHRCPGYNRTEITLTPNITCSAIVSHSSPLPCEICPICMQVVKDAEVFNCTCGEDTESMPTIQCSGCYEWHHRPCVGKPTDQCFLCTNCDPPIFNDHQEFELVSDADGLHTHASSSCRHQVSTTFEKTFTSKPVRSSKRERDGTEFNMSRPVEIPGPGYRLLFNDYAEYEDLITVLAPIARSVVHDSRVWTYTENVARRMRYSAQWDQPECAMELLTIIDERCQQSDFIDLMWSVLQDQPHLYGYLRDIPGGNVARRNVPIRTANYQGLGDH